MKVNESFCGGPGGGFLEKSPLAAGGIGDQDGQSKFSFSSKVFLSILEKKYRLVDPHGGQ